MRFHFHGPILRYHFKQLLKHFWSAIPSALVPQKNFLKVINCSDGAAAPKRLMTYCTTQWRSESDLPATEFERPARRSEMPPKRLERKMVKRAIRVSVRPIGGS